MHQKPEFSGQVRYIPQSRGSALEQYPMQDFRTILKITTIYKGDDVYASLQR